MIDQEAKKQAMSVMLREHLAELRDWYREDVEDDSQSENEESSSSKAAIHRV